MNKNEDQNTRVNKNISVGVTEKVFDRIHVEAFGLNMSKSEFVRWCVLKVFEAQNITRGQISG